MKTLKPWDISLFGQINLPDVVGELKDKEGFSVNRGIRVLDMPVYMPGIGWRVPKEHRQFIEVIAKATHYEMKVNNDIKDFYCYITVDQKPCNPCVSQRRSGCHSDAFIPNHKGEQVDITAENGCHIPNVGLVDRTYLCYDSMPTEFFAGPFTINGDCENVLNNFDIVASTQHPIIYPAYNVLCIDPYDVHRAAINKTSEIIQRTFIKVSFSRIRFNRKLNTHNDLFDYDWAMVERGKERNHRFS